MQAAIQTVAVDISALTSAIPLSVIIAARNEEHNLPHCLESVRDCGEVLVIDSFSTDRTADVAHSYGAKVVQFHYPGGWPKKRQWAMNTLPSSYDWILLLDADEALTPELKQEICAAIKEPHIDGYYIKLQMYFLGRRLRHGGASFYKLALFRRGKGRFECRLREQDASMADIEVHEHVAVKGPTRTLKHPILHRNIGSLARYISKHNEYSNWESRVLAEQNRVHEIPASLFGSPAQRRRWLKRKFYRLPGSPILLFIYRYVFCLGYLDGTPGLIYCGFQAIQMFHTKAKMFEASSRRRTTSLCAE